METGTERLHHKTIRSAGIPGGKEMRMIQIKRETLTETQALETLKERGIQINHYAEQFISHPCFSARGPQEMTTAIVSLQELGLNCGASIYELIHFIKETQYCPCPWDTGYFLRLAWTDQPQSRNSILTGTHSSPDQAVTVLSEPLERDDDFPKGLYLRNVDGDLWLRGYVCDASYRFDSDALFALALRGQQANPDVI